MMVINAVIFLIDSRLGALLLLLTAAYYMFFTKGSIYEKLLHLIVYSAPYYSFSIFGDRQRLSMCIVATLVLCVLLTIRAFKNRTKFNTAVVYKLLLFLIFFIAYGLSLLFGSRAKKDTVFDTYQLVILAYLVIIVSISKNEVLRDIDTGLLMKLFIRGVCAIAIALYIQYGVHHLLGNRLGYIYQYRSGRVIYNIYFNTKSVLSLYISVGMLYYFIEFLKNKRLADLVWLGLLTGTFFMNNSRTGLGCFAICAVLYCLRNFKQTIRSVKVVAVLILACIAGLYIIHFMMGTRSGLESIADDNGRAEQIVAAFKVLPQYIFYGLGGSAMDYRMSSIGIGIHNFFVAYLVQFGVIGGMAVNVLLLFPIFSPKNPYWYYVCCVVIGGMFFTGWQNALYIVPVYILFLLTNNKHNGGIKNATS